MEMPTSTGSWGQELPFQNQLPETHKHPHACQRAPLLSSPNAPKPPWENRRTSTLPAPSCTAGWSLHGLRLSLGLEGTLQCSLGPHNPSVNGMQQTLNNTCRETAPRNTRGLLTGDGSRHCGGMGEGEEGAAQEPALGPVPQGGDRMFPRLHTPALHCRTETG